MTNAKPCAERDGAILLITLNRPNARNAVNGALAAAGGGGRRARR